MRLRASLLHKSLNVGSVLAMTATATTTTLDAVMSALDIPYTNLIQNAHLRDNLRLSVSLIKNRQVRCFSYCFGLFPFNSSYLIFVKRIHQ
jgi:ATP-dependent DNA helicase Q4